MRREYSYLRLFTFNTLGGTQFSKIVRSLLSGTRGSNAIYPQLCVPRPVDYTDLTRTHHSIFSLPITDGRDYSTIYPNVFFEPRSCMHIASAIR